MRNRFWWAWFLGVALTGCQLPVYDPPAPVPVPVNPTPVDPGPQPSPTTQGAITEEAYAAVGTGMTEADLLTTAGQPFRKSETAGFTVYLYQFPGTPNVAWFFVKGGVVERKERR